jgi:hypothetical protein
MRVIDEKINSPKSIGNAVILTRNKLRKDLSTLYDVIMRTHPELEGQTLIFAEMFSTLKVFTELKAINIQSKLDSNILFAIESSPVMTSESGSFSKRSSNKPLPLSRIQKGHEERKAMEEECYVLIARVVSYSKEGVSKNSVIELIYTLITLEDNLMAEVKCQILQKTLKINHLNEEGANDMKNLIRIFRTLAKGSIETRYIAHFMDKLKRKRKSSAEKQASECTFIPQINKKSRASFRSKRNSSERRTEDNKTNPYEELYKDYKERLKNLELVKKIKEIQSNKELTFKPQILNTPCNKEEIDRVIINLTIIVQ